MRWFEYYDADDPLTLAEAETFLAEAAADLHARAEVDWQLKELGLAAALVTVVAVAALLLMCKKVAEFEEMLKLREAEVAERFSKAALRSEVLREFQRVNSEQLIVEDVENEHKDVAHKDEHDSEDIKDKKHSHHHHHKHHDHHHNQDRHHKHHHHHKHRDNDDPRDEGEEDTDQVVNIENSVVYITSSPPSPSHQQ